MRQFNNRWSYETGNSSTAPMASSPSFTYLSVMPEIHILLVDYDSESRINTASVLELCRYRVSQVDLAGGALQMLLAGKWIFDLILANVNSPDLQGYQLLQQAVAVEIPLILTGPEENSFLARRALDNGVYLFLRKPITMEVASCLWQYVMREKLRLAREREQQAAATFYNAARGGVEIREPREENHNNSAKTNNAKWKNGRNEDFDEEDDGSSGNRGAFGGKVKKRMCTEWTRELHDKFVDAVEQLGEGRCFPKEILELMDVPGLTRMQVASHLQKCRNDNWRAPEERKSNLSQNPTDNLNHSSHTKPRRFGTMPKTVALAAALKDASRGGDSTVAVAREGSKTLEDSETEVQNGGGAHNVLPEPQLVVVPLPVPNRATDVPLPYRPANGQMVPLPENATPPAAAGPYHVNQRNASDDFLFNFNEMESMVESHVGLPPPPGMMGSNIASLSGGRFHLEPIYCHHVGQNGGGMGMESRSQSSNQDSESTRSGR